MALKELMPWRWGGLRHWEGDSRPMDVLRREMAALHDEMDRLFEDFWRNGGRSGMLTERWSHSDLLPDVDQSEDDKSYHVTVELPGLAKDDVEITLSAGMLTIRGEKKQEEEKEGKGIYRRERSFGTFSRVLPIPGEVQESKIKASFKNGVLSIDLPKSESAQKQVKHIDISAAA